MEIRGVIPFLNKHSTLKELPVLSPLDRDILVCTVCHPRVTQVPVVDSVVPHGVSIPYLFVPLCPLFSFRY